MGRDREASGTSDGTLSEDHHGLPIREAGGPVAVRRAMYLRERRQAGLGTATSNGYLTSLKTFANWLVKNRRMPVIELTHLAKLNAKADIRHERRVLTNDELARLIHAAELSTRTFRGLDGGT